MSFLQSTRRSGGGAAAMTWLLMEVWLNGLLASSPEAMAYRCVPFGEDVFAMSLNERLS